ncbi:MAG TPA: MFS transporter, partial [Edaphobacter sp.]|nr:MFS transporter [Edaphobacter sp.]
GPLWIGHMYDRAGAYMPRFIVYLAAVAFGAVILSFCLPADRESIQSEQEMGVNAGVPLEG